MSYCKIPFERITISASGNVSTCCSFWLPEPIGNIFEEPDLEKIWNSDTAQKIRLSMINETFEFCNHEYCPYLLKGMLKPKKKKTILNNNITNTRLSTGPRILAVSYDYTCNLYCKSCRSKILALSKKKIDFFLKFQKNLLQTSFFRNVEELTLSGSGDPFASQVCLTLLQNIKVERFPDLKITLMTNGVLFTPENWGKISDCHYAVNFIKISIDAATKETYSKVRRGGDFDKLINNLSFISGLKQNKELKLQAVFLMQKDNYKEMPMFVNLMKKYNFDRIHFSKIKNWGTYTEEEFKQVAIHRKDHPERKNFWDILSDPILEDPIVSIQMSEQEYL